MPVGLQRKMQLVVNLMAALNAPKTAFVDSKRVVVARNFMMKKNLVERTRMKKFKRGSHVFVLFAQKNSLTLSQSQMT